MAAEMAWQSRVTSALTEDPSPNTATHGHSRGSDALFWTPEAFLHTWYIKTNAGTHIYAHEYK